ncbi:MAG: YHYH protein, partial [Chthoniobacteraceae bacterium]
MKPCRTRFLLGISIGLARVAAAHDFNGEPHPQSENPANPPVWIFAQAITSQNRARTGERSVRTNRPAQAAVFEAFAPKVSVRWDEKFLFVESNGLPSHNMMTGITAWQQQVPLPQAYTGTNAWQIPLVPVVAKEPRSIKGQFLRGAIALAANGIPIFNPQNNRGEVSQEIGELDQWGGHCGRADDYHYHSAPLHLQSVVGKGQPIAYALDGYPILGLTEPDGSQPAKLDAFNGHTTALGYHYHASNKYPYVNGGFHGEVTERDQQVDPQPRANPVREAGAPLRGAKITGFESTGANSYKLSYEVNGDKRAVLYAINADGTFPFEFQNGKSGATKETYTLRNRGAGRGGPGGPGGDRPPRGGGGGDADRPPRPEDGPGGPPPRDGAGGPERGGQQGGPGRKEGGAQAPVSRFGPDAMKMPNATFLLRSTEVKDGGALPMDYTGDGSGATLPLAWKGAPAGTKGYALIMDHVAPGNVMKHYWTMWDIPATTTSLPKNVKGVGKLGTSFKGQIGYEPPHSQGPGAKTYVLTVYALSAPLQIMQQPHEVNRDVLLAAMKDKVLASSSLSVVYTRSGGASNDGQRPPRREGGAGGPPPPRDDAPPPRREDGASANGIPSAVTQAVATTPPEQQIAAADQPPLPPPQQPGERRPGGPAGKGGPGGKGGGGKPDNKGLIKPTMADTIKVNVYADNWFVLFINGELTAVDSIKFTPHNVV